MPRNLTAAMISELTAASNVPIWLVDLTFGNLTSPNTLHFWTGIGDLSWNGDTYLGNGWFVGPDAPAEDGEVVPQGVSISLSGVPPALLSLALSEAAAANPAQIWFGFLNSSNQVIADPFLVYNGTIDTVEISESDETPEIRITVESRLIEADKIKEFRYTEASQKLFYPDDKGFEFVLGLDDWDGTWGKVKKKKTKKKKKKKKRRRQ